MRTPHWRPFRSVLCAVDFSETSAIALGYAAHIAARAAAPLTVAFANDPLLVAAAAAALHRRDIAKRSERELDDFVKATLPRDAARDVRLDVTVSEPDVAILDAARRRRADLIVIGTSGLTGAERLIVGSTARAVLQRTAVPVLAIPRLAAPLARRAGWPGRCIVAAIDLDGSAARDIRLASDVARWFRSSLLLVHVVPELAAPHWLRTEVAAGRGDVLSGARLRLETLAARYASNADARVVSGRLGEEIAAAAAAEQSGLVLTVLRGRAGWFRSRRGATSYDLLAGSPLPVLAFPSPPQGR